ncbi:MAG: rhomboid family intramembrane serine protease [Pedosphaera sp.]|nr:rhomboid family intramembrane serine protease [Pedosphaera sp.]
METTVATETVRIPTRTRRRAMDWSLALVSQGIENVIRQEPDDGWQLVVSAADAERARATIEQFRRENLRWPWRREVWHGRAMFDWAGLLWVLLTGAFFFTPANNFHAAGIMDAAAVARGEWWRIFTAEVLHADLLHFATNTIFGLLLLGLAMGRYGTGVGLLGAYLAGAAGNVVSWWVHGDAHRSLGASGVVMGALGLLAAQSVWQLRGNPRALRLALGGLAGGLMLFLILGLSPGSDVAAHFGGFVAGAILGGVLAFVPRVAERSLLNLGAGFLLAALIVWPWLLALRAHP